MLSKEFSIFSNKSIPNELNSNQFYFLPHPMLRPYVSHYTFSYSIASNHSAPAGNLVIVPDGSGCFIYIYSDNGLVEKCWGPTTKPVVVEKHNNDINERSFFIEFAPGGLRTLFNIDVASLTDKQVEIRDLNNKEASLLKGLILTSNSISDIIYRVEQALLNIIEGKQVNRCVFSIINTVKFKSGICNVKELSSSAYISERHLNRLFKSYTGLSVKKFSRLTRLNNTIKLYQANRDSTSSEIAQQFGFFDESHLIKDFREFCNTTPNNYLKNMSEFYNEPFKY